jgi:hypothetical protein
MPPICLHADFWEDLVVTVRVAAYVFNFVISLCIFEPQRFKYLPKDQHLP